MLIAFYKAGHWQNRQGIYVYHSISACQPYRVVRRKTEYALQRLDVLDHPHQVRAVGLASGLARIDELLDDDRVQLARLAQVRFTLGRDREPLVAATLGGLLLGGDTQVGDCERGGLADSIQRVGVGWLCESHGSRFLPQRVGPARTAGTARAVRLVTGNTARMRL